MTHIYCELPYSMLAHEETGQFIEECYDTLAEGGVIRFAIASRSDLLMEMLEQIGFRNIKRCEYNKSEHNYLIGIDRSKWSMFVEATKVKGEDNGV